MLSVHFLNLIWMPTGFWKNMIDIRLSKNFFQYYFSLSLVLVLVSSLERTFPTCNAPNLPVDFSTGDVNTWMSCTFLFVEMSAENIIKSSCWSALWSQAIVNSTTSVSTASRQIASTSQVAILEHTSIEENFDLSSHSSTFEFWRLFHLHLEVRLNRNLTAHRFDLKFWQHYGTIVC